MPLKADLPRTVLYAILGLFLLCWPLTLNRIVFHSVNPLIYPAPLYKNLNYIGETAGADFGQIYFASNAWKAGQSPYSPRDPEFREPLKRVPAYPMFTIFAFSPLSALGFEKALFVHLFAEVSIFFLILLLLGLHARNEKRMILRVQLAALACLFFTPVGITFLQQGQFDLYVASAILLSAYLVISKIKPHSRRGGFLLTGILIGIKWTAMPIFLFISCWDIFVNKSKDSLITWAVLLLTVAAFPGHFREYLVVLSFWESQSPAGISFHHLGAMVSLPSFVLPLFFVALSILAVQMGRKQDSAASFLSFLIPLSIFSLGLGKMAFEYRTLSILGLFAILSINQKQGEKMTLLYWFFSMFFVFSLRVFPFQEVDETTYSAAFFISSILLFVWAVRASANATNEKTAK